MADYTFERLAAQKFEQRMAAALNGKGMTRAQMQAALFASKTKMLNYIRFMHGKVDGIKRIYICGYEELPTGGRNPIYTLGDRPDKKPPGARTDQERYKQRKADPDKHQRYLARLRASAAAKRSREKPVSIFAALGL